MNIAAPSKSRDQFSRDLSSNLGKTQTSKRDVSVLEDDEASHQKLSSMVIIPKLAEDNPPTRSKTKQDPNIPLFKSHRRRFILHRMRNNLTEQDDKMNSPGSTWRFNDLNSTFRHVVKPQ